MFLRFTLEAACSLANWGDLDKVLLGGLQAMDLALRIRRLIHADFLVHFHVLVINDDFVVGDGTGVGANQIPVNVQS